MSNFTDKIQARIPKIAEQERQRVEAEQAAQRRKLAQEQKEQWLRERAQRIGTEVVQLLWERGVPPLPIWTPRDRTTQPIHYEQSGDGWHVDSFYKPSSENGIIIHRAINFDGVISRFHFTSHNGFDGIVDPYDIHPEHLLPTLEDDHFQDGVASLIYLQRPYGPNR